MTRFLIAAAIWIVFRLWETWVFAGAPKTLGCDVARDLLGWEQCQVTDRLTDGVKLRGCRITDAQAYIVRGAGKQALVCCSVLFENCTATPERPWTPGRT